MKSSITPRRRSNTSTRVLLVHNVVTFALFLLSSGGGQHRRGGFVIVADAAATPTTPPNNNNEEIFCINSTELRYRMSNAYDPNTGRATHHASQIGGIIDNVLSEEECRLAVEILTRKPGGFDDNERDGGYGKLRPPEGFTGLSVHDLSSSDSLTRDDYATLLSYREKARVVAEQTLGLCPGTLRIDFTHFTRKLVGGDHRTHADNCFARVGDDTPNGSLVAVCDSGDNNNRPHPYPSRVVGSILYLNDQYEGGEFFWADQKTGHPKTIAVPMPGRMVVFTSGPESLHGALPVREMREIGRMNDEGQIEEDDAGLMKTQRIALALWYNDDNWGIEERVPPLASSTVVDDVPKSEVEECIDGMTGNCEL